MLKSPKIMSFPGRVRAFSFIAKWAKFDYKKCLTKHFVIFRNNDVAKVAQLYRIYFLPISALVQGDLDGVTPIITETPPSTQL